MEERGERGEERGEQEWRRKMDGERSEGVKEEDGWREEREEEDGWREEREEEDGGERSALTDADKVNTG
ncbi:hypothetical protein CgunFtcFv8_001205 [Champsocephalus gunnari]|uniref:Uncharacterized protein n=1 Tax=Champsocephalus gunnari TaxID=52237 RepID=A0AAN8DQG0_CHAGU|nr:hypothetical protein CgunFtcFv8_001205 [Champsocephalus gunnari]